MRTISVSGVAVAMLMTVMLVPLSACGQRQTAAERPEPTSRNVIPKSDSQGDGRSGDVPQGANPASKQAAERYRDCLVSSGVPAEIMDGNWVVLQWEGGDSGSVSAGSDDKDRDKAIRDCQAKVPDYRDPDFNTK